jgi:hypothetical protein
VLQFGHNIIIFMDATFNTDMWNTTCSHWWHLIFIRHGCQLLGSSWIDKYAKIWWSGWVFCKQSSSCISHIRNYMFHCRWCPKGTPNIGVSFILFFGCIILCFCIILAWGLHNIFIIHGKHTNVGCTMAWLCGAEILSHFFFAYDMCWKHDICIPWTKSRIQRWCV